MQTVHDKVTPFKCEICDLKFEKSSNQIGHMRNVHKNLKPFECRLCASKFAKKYPYDRNLHHSKFGHQIDLIQSKTSVHVIAETNSSFQTLKQFDNNCQICDFKFNNRTTLTAHILEFHFKKYSSSLSPKKRKKTIKSKLCVCQNFM